MVIDNRQNFKESFRVRLKMKTEAQFETVYQNSTQKIIVVVARNYAHALEFMRKENVTFDYHKVLRKASPERKINVQWGRYAFIKEK